MLPTRGPQAVRAPAQAALRSAPRTCLCTCASPSPDSEKLNFRVHGYGHLAILNDFRLVEKWPQHEVPPTSPKLPAYVSTAQPQRPGHATRATRSPAVPLGDTSTLATVLVFWPGTQSRRPHCILLACLLSHSLVPVPRSLRAVDLVTAEHSSATLWHVPQPGPACNLLLIQEVVHFGQQWYKKRGRVLLGASRQGSVMFPLNMW